MISWLEHLMRLNRDLFKGWLRRIDPEMKIRMAGILVLWASLGSIMGAASVGQWERFEAALTNTTPYRDPYREVALHVRYTRPDGNIVPFRGFYDGGSTWRLRFMPDQPGTWKYTATFSDGTEGAEGAFECVPSDLPGPVRAFPVNPIWFSWGNGSPFLMRSLHCGDRFFARNWDDADSPQDGEKRKVFLDWAQQQGYNTLSIASFLLNRQVAGRGQGWDTPRLWPLNAAEFQRAEVILNDLAARRMVVFPFAGFLGRDSNFPRDPEDRSLYLSYVVARLGPYWNLLFNVGGPEPLLKGKPFLTFAEIGQIATELRSLDVFNHLLTVHNATGDDAFRNEPWLGFGTLQGPKTINRRRLAEVLLRNHHPERPLYAQETLWPGNNVGHPPYGDEDIRRNALVMLFSAAMINFGDMNGNSSSGFSNSMEPAQALTNRHAIIRQAWETFAGLPWPHTRPRPDLVNTGFCLALPGHTYLVYLDQPAVVDVKTETGPYHVDWFNTRQGSRSVAQSDTLDGRGLRPPGEGDWIVMLRAKSDNVFREQNGAILIEAEQGRGDWTLIPSPTGRAIQDPGEGRMRYQVEFARPGKYYVFLLARQGPRGKDKENDVLLSLDGEKLYGQDDTTRPDGMRSYGGWKWTGLPKGPGAHTPDAIRRGPVYFLVAKAGRHTLEIAHRSSHFAVDKVLLKRDDPTVPAK